VGAWRIYTALSLFVDPYRVDLWRDERRIPCADVYARKLDVINRGMSGYNAEWALPVLQQVGGVRVFGRHKL
jgi:isoamyl acetate esterase